MKNKILLGVISILLMTTLMGCKTSLAYTFTVTTGDKIKVSLDTSDDWTLEEKDGTFTVKSKDDKILQGVFGTKDDYSKMEQAIANDSAVTVIENSTRDGNTYIFYSYEGENGSENDIVLMVKNASTCIIMGSTAEQETAKAAFERLTITKE